MITQTLESGTYTRLELYWQLCRYAKELTGEALSDRTFRRWRQRLGILPDGAGMYWQSDLERLKEAIRLLSQRQTLDQIVELQRSKTYANN